MPKIPALSSQTRKYTLGQINSFFDIDEPELTRRLILKSFEETLQPVYPDKTFSFFDRVGVGDLELH